MGRSDSSTALTLVELLVAMAILVTVTASTALIFRGITRAWRTGELRTERYQQARLLFDLFERELSSCVASPRYPLVGAANALSFVGTLPGRTGFVERGYSVSEDGTLLCHDDEAADGDYATGTSEICGHDVAGFEVSYFDGTAWVDHWDAHPLGQLPKAVHLTLTIGRQRPERFETVIYVPTS